MTAWPARAVLCASAALWLAACGGGGTRLELCGLDSQGVSVSIAAGTGRCETGAQAAPAPGSHQGTTGFTTGLNR